MKDLAIVHVTFGTVEEAEQVARILIEEGLAACANIHSSCMSIYRWKESVEREVEVPVFFKTSMGQAAALQERLAELHSYELPAIALWPAAAAEAMGDWIEESTRP